MTISSALATHRTRLTPKTIPPDDVAVRWLERDGHIGSEIQRAALDMLVTDRIPRKKRRHQGERPTPFRTRIDEGGLRIGHSQPKAPPGLDTLFIPVSPRIHMDGIPGLQVMTGQGLRSGNCSKIRVTSSSIRASIRCWLSTTPSTFPSAHPRQSTLFVLASTRSITSVPAS